MRSCHDDLREDTLLEDVYGNEGKLDNDIWLKAICEKAKWVFNAKEFRKLVFKQAEVEYKVSK